MYRVKLILEFNKRLNLIYFQIFISIIVLFVEPSICFKRANVTYINQCETKYSCSVRR